MRIYVVLLALAATVSPALAEEDCFAGKTQGEITECARDDYRTEDAKLNKVYRQITDRLKSKDKDDDGYFRNILKALIKAQRAWIAFRDAECAFVGSKTTGGSVNSSIIGACLSGLTQQRRKELEEYLDCKEGDLSCPVPASD
jgi:uncharacterized protein YecT (DUF1311 family)